MNQSSIAPVEITVRRYRTIAVFLGLTVAWLSMSPAARARKGPRISYFDRLKLANWKQVVRVDKSTNFWKPTGMLLIAAKPSEVMSTFMDFGSINTFMPKVKSCRVVRRRGKHKIWAVVFLDLPWPVANAWVAVRYDWSRAPSGSYKLNWVRHRGSMKRYWGKLRLWPWGKNWTLAVSTMQAVPDAHISRSRLNKGIVWGSEQMLHHLRAEVDRRRRKGLLKPYNP